MTVVKLYPDPSRLEYLTFADFAEVAIICYRPKRTLNFRVSHSLLLVSSAVVSCKRTIKRNLKTFENSRLEGILDILNEDFR